MVIHSNFSPQIGIMTNIMGISTANASKNNTFQCSIVNKVGRCFNAF